MVNDLACIVILIHGPGCMKMEGVEKEEITNNVFLLWKLMKNNEMWNPIIIYLSKYI